MVYEIWIFRFLSGMVDGFILAIGGTAFPCQMQGNYQPLIRAFIRGSLVAVFHAYTSRQDFALSSQVELQGVEP